MNNKTRIKKNKNGNGINKIVLYNHVKIKQFSLIIFNNNTYLDVF